MSSSHREQNFDPWKASIEGSEPSFPLYGDEAKVVQREDRLAPRSLRNSIADFSIAHVADLTHEGRHVKTPLEAATYVHRSFAPKADKPSARHRAGA